MSSISVTEARGQLPEVVERSRSEAVLLEKRGAVVAVIVSPDFYQRALDALEEADDVVAFDEAMVEEGPDLPWAQAKADLGWG
jgi:prevent-host-death family protein